MAAVREVSRGDRHLVIYGYGQLAQALLDHGLVDQLNFVINPVMAGSGTTLSAPASARSCAWSRSPSAATARSPCPTQTPEGQQAE